MNQVSDSFFISDGARCSIDSTFEFRHSDLVDVEAARGGATTEIVITPSSLDGSSGGGATYDQDQQQQQQQQRRRSLPRVIVEENSSSVDRFATTTTATDDNTTAEETTEPEGFDRDGRRTQTFLSSFARKVLIVLVTYWAVRRGCSFDSLFT